jgi:hypothetical protein
MNRHLTYDIVFLRVLRSGSHPANGKGHHHSPTLLRVKANVSHPTLLLSLKREREKSDRERERERERE